MPYKYNDDTDDDSDHHERDPGREVIEKNMRNRLQRIADNTKDELSKVLKRVDKTLVNYEASVQSSLVQHGMPRHGKSNVEHVADINELETLLNDSIAKQKYKQRLTVFIVGQTELASEKASLLQQIEQFFNEQKQSFSGTEFNTYDVRNETQDEVDLTLRSFDVKDCYVHVKELGTRLNELNEDIIQYLIQNAAAKQQAKGKKKFAQATKETKDQLSALQQRLETANNDITSKDSKIETLEKANETLQHDLKSKQEYLKQLQQEVVQYTLEIKSRNKHITELESELKQYENQIGELKNTIAAMEQAKVEVPVDTTETDDTEHATVNEEAEPKIDKETQTITPRTEKPSRTQQIPSDDSLPDLNVLLNVPDGIDLNHVTDENLPTAFVNLRKSAGIRVTELMKELEMKESINNEALEDLKQEYAEYRLASEKEQNSLLEKANVAYQLQLKAEEAYNQLELYMAEQEKLKSSLIRTRTETDQEDALHDMTSTPEESIPIVEISNERLSSDSEDDNLEDDASKDGRRTSSKEKYRSFIEDRKTQLGPRRHQVEAESRRASLREGGPMQSLDVNTALIKQRSSLYRHYDQENQTVKHNQEQQTSAVNSRSSSRRNDKFTSQTAQTDEYELPFFQMYESIYNFRQSIIHLLEKHQFVTLADRLLMIRQLSSSDDHYKAEDFIQNSDHALKDTCKVLKLCLTLLLSSIHEYQLKEQAALKESSQPTREPSMMDDQHALLLEQKESMIIDLTTKYEHLTDILSQRNAKHEEELNQSERLIRDQQKIIQNLQQQVILLQKRLTKLEAEGVVEPSIMFTRLDAERNEQALQQAVHRGKVLETTYHELNEAMEDYVSLPSQQLANLVKRYVQFRKATELGDRIETQVTDSETQMVLEKMEALYERRSDEMSRQMLDIRQQRSNLAKVLTEKFDNLEDENSIFLIRPVYSYQGRAAAQSYMKQEKRRREALINGSDTRKTPHPTRQIQRPNNPYNENQHMSTPMSSFRTSNDERVFNLEQSIPARLSPTRQHIGSRDGQHPQQFTVKLSELTRLQEYDIQRTLMPMSHVSTPLLSAVANNSIDPCVPSLNLRSYLALSRPGIGNVRSGSTNEVIHTVSREAPPSVSGKSPGSETRTPLNSTMGNQRRASPPLPPIKRSGPSGMSATTNEKPYNRLVNTNEISSAT